MSAWNATLAEAVEPWAVGVDVLRRRHGPLLSVAEQLLGVVPNCHRYLAIWPTGFRTYNLVVPTFLNMPSLVFGSGEQKTLVGLVMYASSRAAQCSYCSAHSCTFAMRRGATEAAIAHAVTPRSDAGGFDARHRAALTVADAMGQLPDSLTDGDREEFSRLFSSSEAEHLVLAVAMMGFLNKFMDGMGVPLEDMPFRDATRVIAPTGWSPGKHRSSNADGGPELPPTRSGDSFAGTLRLVPLMPSLIARERHWTAGVPSRWPTTGSYLRERVGHDFPVLAKLTSKRAVRALATILRDNTDPTVSELGLHTKSLAGIVYASAAGDDQLLRAVERLAETAGATAAQREGGIEGLDARAITALELAHAASTSPAQITPEIIDHAQAALSPSAIVELMVWISALQLLHRLHVFYR